jgi:hypothetical protein
MSIGRKRAVAAALAVVALLVACTDSPPSATASASAGTGNDGAEQVFRDFLAAINSGDAEAAGDLLAPEATVFGQAVATTGSDAAIASFECAADISSVEADGESLIVELDFTGAAPLATTDDCQERPAGRYRVTVTDGQIMEFAEAGS